MRWTPGGMIYCIVMSLDEHLRFRYPCYNQLGCQWHGNQMRILSREHVVALNR